LADIKSLEIAMRTVVACTFIALFGGGSTLAMAAHPYDNDMSYARVMQVEPIYTTTVYRHPQHESGYRHADAERRFCATVADAAYREEVIAYRVYYRYHGHDLVSEMDYDPGPLLKVHANFETDD
jgi:hypothetical protein